jgi:DNA-binding transcriptional ArsR family regulator
MGVTKSDHFSAEQNEMALICKALGHPARIAIIDYLLTVDSCICGDIVDQLPLSQPTVSQHLKELKNAKLIKGNIEGNAICYCVNTQMITKLQLYLQHVSNTLDHPNNCCS